MQDTADASECIKSVVFIATRWGSAYGGINSFNEDLVSTLAQNVEQGVLVVCVVTTASDVEISAAGTRGVTLLHIDESTDSFAPNSEHAINARLKSAGIERISWIVGHDASTGVIAYRLRRSYHPTAKYILFHHMDLGAYEFLKSSRTPKMAQIKVAEQIAILREAEIVVAIGPKLEKSARDKINNKDVQIYKILPGLSDAVQMQHRRPNSFSAIIFGRLDIETDRVKQATLAVVAFARAVKKHSGFFGLDASLTVLGLPTDEEDAQNQRQALLRIAESEAGFAINIKAYPYLENRKALYSEVASKSVALMLSVHEGFGLTGWESIAAGVPLIVSENSGAYIAIQDLLGGMGTGCLQHLEVRGSTTDDKPYTEDDVERVVEALVAVRLKEEETRKDARNLSRLLKSRCQWRACAKEFAEAAGIPIRKMLLELEIAGSAFDELELDLGSTFRERHVSVLSSRRTVFSQVEAALDSAKKPLSLIIFGGVADSLRNEPMTRKYADWLNSNKLNRLYVCYEVGAAATARATTLTSERMDPNTGPVDPLLRMKKKEEEVHAFKDRLSGLLNANAHQAVFIGLQQYLTTYVIIVDKDLYLTPLFNRRSTDSVSFWCSPLAAELHAQTRDYMAHHLRAVIEVAHAKLLLDQVVDSRRFQA